jgi:hypothetical protein
MFTIIGLSLSGWILFSKTKAAILENRGFGLSELSGDDCYPDSPASPALAATLPNQ